MERHSPIPLEVPGEVSRQPIGRRALSCCGTLGVGSRDVHIEDRELTEHLAFGLEMFEQGGLPNADLFGDGTGGRATEAVNREQLRGCQQNPIAGSPFSPWRRGQLELVTLGILNDLRHVRPLALWNEAMSKAIS